MNLVPFRLLLAKVFVEMCLQTVHSLSHFLIGFLKLC